MGNLLIFLTFKNWSGIARRESLPSPSPQPLPTSPHYHHSHYQHHHHHHHHQHQHHHHHHHHHRHRCRRRCRKLLFVSRRARYHSLLPSLFLLLCSLASRFFDLWQQSSPGFYPYLAFEGRTAILNAKRTLGMKLLWPLS